MVIIFFIAYLNFIFCCKVTDYSLLCFYEKVGFNFTNFSK